MKKIILLFLIFSNFLFSQITLIGVNCTISGTATVKTITAFNGTNYLPISGGSGFPMNGSVYVSNGFGISNTSNNAQISFPTSSVVFSSGSATGVTSSEFNALTPSVSSLVFNISTGKLSNYIQGETGISITGTSALFSGIDFLIDNSANWKPHSAVDKSYVDNKITSSTITSSSFGGLSYKTISTSKRIVYIAHGNDYINPSISYDDINAPSQAIIDVGLVPTLNIIIGFVSP